ncbi:hypothetical protein PENTCL1PPCAC_15065, partial [Pristionchus entomophagus]
ITPLFEERLIGHWWHNITLLSTLQTNGYQFLVVPSGFTVHHQHSSSFEISRHTGPALDQSFVKLAERVSASSH